MAATIEGIHHIPAEEAAKLLGISSDRVLDLVVDGVLEARFGLYGDLLVFIYGEDQPHPTRIPEGEKGRTGEAETTAGFHHGDTETRRTAEEGRHPKPDSESDLGIFAPLREVPPSPSAPTPERRYLHGQELLTTADVCERLHIRSSHVSKLIANGRLNAIKEGRRWWILAEDVETYARQQQIWRSLGGAWTPYGRLPRRPPTLCSSLRANTPIDTSTRRS